MTHLKETLLRSTMLTSPASLRRQSLRELVRLWLSVPPGELPKF